jgi:hypothetical protein
MIQKLTKLIKFRSDMNINEFFQLLIYPAPISATQKQHFIEKIIKEKVDYLETNILHQAILHSDVTLVKALMIYPFDLLEKIDSPMLTLIHNKSIIQLCDMVVQQSQKRSDSLIFICATEIQELIVAQFEKQLLEKNQSSIQSKQTESQSIEKKSILKI